LEERMDANKMTAFGYVEPTENKKKVNLQRFTAQFKS
jgi:hypothetical protein